MRTRSLDTLVLTLGLGFVTLDLVACKGDDEGESGTAADAESSGSASESSTSTGTDAESSGSGMTTSDTNCIPGELGCTCNDGLCLGDLVCENDICTDPDCIPGELACECNMGLCLGDLVCVDGVCLEDGGTTSSTDSTGETMGTSGTDSTTGMECPNPNEMMCDGVCVDVVSNNDHCGGCGVVCKVHELPNPDIGVCIDGACSPTLSECVAQADGWMNCDQICAAEGTICVEEGCNGATSYTGSLVSCQAVSTNGLSDTPQACGTNISWNNGTHGRCCCEQ
jgi:hypothetical protein